jgi:hypothetical protein
MDRLFRAGAASFCCGLVFGQKRMQPIELMDCIFECTAMCDCCVWWNLRWLLRFLCLVNLFTGTARFTRGVKVPLLAVSLSPA